MLYSDKFDNTIAKAVQRLKTTFYLTLMQRQHNNKRVKKNLFKNIKKVNFNLIYSWYQNECFLRMLGCTYLGHIKFRSL